MAAAVALPPQTVPVPRVVVALPRTRSIPRAGRQGRSVGVPHHPVRPASRRHRSVAVYRRRRIVAAAVGFGLVVMAGQAAAALDGSSLAPGERRPPAGETVVVEPGDTLWAIARRLAPDEDPRVVVDRLVQSRGTATVVPGETVSLRDA